MDWFKATSTGAHGFYSQIQASSDGSRWQPFEENTYRFLRTAGFLSPGSCFNSTGRARRCTAGWCQCRISVTVFLVGDLSPRIYTILYIYITISCCSCQVLQRPLGCRCCRRPWAKSQRSCFDSSRPAELCCYKAGQRPFKGWGHQGHLGAPGFLRMMGNDMTMMGWCLGSFFFEIWTFLILRSKCFILNYSHVGMQPTVYLQR